MLYKTQIKTTVLPLLKAQTRQRNLLLVKEMKLNPELATFLLERYLSTNSTKL